MAFHVTADDILPMEGGPGPGLDAAGIDVARADAATGTAGQLKPIRESITGIAERYGCEPEPPVERVSDHVTEEAYEGCDEGADVVFFTVEGGGHAWPGGLANPALDGLLGQATQEISANALMWEFFEQHPLPAG
jgi:polyhydroxybutyrate depolymerase